MNTHPPVILLLYDLLKLLEAGEAQEAADKIHETLHDSGFYTSQVRVPETGGQQPWQTSLI